MIITKEEAQALLPKVGDERMEYPTVDDTPGHTLPKEPKRCTVVAVYPAHLWYIVQFENGVRESYKVPNIKPTSPGGGSR